MIPPPYDLLIRFAAPGDAFVFHFCVFSCAAAMLREITAVLPNCMTVSQRNTAQGAKDVDATSEVVSKEENKTKQKK